MGDFAFLNLPHGRLPANAFVAAFPLFRLRMLLVRDALAIDTEIIFDGAIWALTTPKVSIVGLCFLTRSLAKL
jgi:hypothetical protein